MSHAGEQIRLDILTTDVKKITGKTIWDKDPQDIHEKELI